MKRDIHIIRFPKGSTFRRPKQDMEAYWSVLENWYYITSCEGR